MCKGDASYATRLLDETMYFAGGGTMDAADRKLKVYGIGRPAHIEHKSHRI